MDIDQLIDVMMTTNWEPFSVSPSQDTIGSSNTTHQPPHQQQQNRGILEPILEEESDDDDDEDEAGCWSLQSSSSACSGDSVVQLAEVNFLPGLLVRNNHHNNNINGGGNGLTAEDLAETLSERDFLCPAKRRRQDQNSVETKRYRLDDYPPCDTFSESSLSRSSSLIQFESLERQMQSDNSAPLPVIVDQDFERFIPLAVVHQQQQQQQQQQSHFVPVTVSIKTKVGTHLSYDKNQHHHHRLSDAAGASDSINRHTSTTLSTFFSAAAAAQFAGKSAADHPGEDLEEVHEFIDRKVTLPITFQRISLGGDDRDHHHTFAAQLGGGSCSRGKNSLEELSEDSGYCGEHSLSQLVQLNAAIESSRATDAEINNQLTRDHRSSTSSSSSSSRSIATASSTPNGSLSAATGTSEKVYDDGEDEEEELQQLRGLKIAAENRERYSPNRNGDEDYDEVDDDGDMVRHRGAAVGALPRIDDCDEDEEEEEEEGEGTSPTAESSKNTRENKRFLRRKNRSAHFPFGRKRKLGACQRIASRSLPNIFLNQLTPTTTTAAAAADCDQSNSSSAVNECCTGGFSGRSSASVSAKDPIKCPGVDSGDLLSDEFLKVNSFPEGLNYLLSGSCSDNNLDDEDDSDGGDAEGEEGDSDPGDCYDFEECQEFFSNDFYFMREPDGSGVGDYFYPENVGGGSTIASKNLDLNQLLQGASSSSINRSFSCRTAEPAVLQHQTKAGLLSASYSNLTALDYSAPSVSSHGRLFTKMDKRSGSGSGSGGGARPTIANPEITLLDEVSFNFDKNLSILNDRCGNFEPLIEDEDGEVEEQEEYGAVIGILNIKKPPKPPPRRYRKGDSMENLRVPGESSSVTGGSSKASSRESLTFDRDPTNLVTCYAASLERCNFSTLDQPQPMNYHHRSSASSLQHQQDHSMMTTTATNHHHNHQSQSGNKELVVSTPNLSIRRDLQVFNDDALSPENKSRTMGILNVSSRGSLYKEVSFHPIVSEISWRHEKQSEEEEEEEDDSLSEDSLDDGQHDAGNDSDVESDGGKYRDDAEEDYFGLKKNENFKDLDLKSPPGKSSSTPVLSIGEPIPRQIITIKKTIILTPTRDQQQPPAINPDDLVINNINSVQQSPSNNSTSPIISTSPTVDNDRGSSRSSAVLVSSENASSGESVIKSAEDRSNSQQEQNNNHRTVSDHLTGSVIAMPQSSSTNSSSSLPRSMPRNNGGGVAADLDAPPKKRKNSFFSRLSSFRFSLKNSKKEQQQQQKKSAEKPPITVTALPTATIHKAQTASSSSPAQKRNAPFVHIPLKDPIDKLDHFSKQKLAIQKQLQHNEQQQMFLEAERRREQNTQQQRLIHDQMHPQQLMRPPTTILEQQQQQQQLPFPGSRFVNNNNNNHNHNNNPHHSNGVLHKKPPLPKHPPRVIGVCAKRCADAAAASQKGGSGGAAQDDNNNNNNNNNNSHRVSPQRQSSGQSCSGGSSTEDAAEFRFVSHNPRRGVSATMPTRPPGGGGGGGGGGGTGAAGNGNGNGATSGSFNKIGLIETNLDTHETVISGKTRSLMELHPQHQYQRPPRYSQQVQHRGRVREGADEVARQSLGHTPSSISGPAGEAVVGIRPRPHKSMEFLLDKENQLFTLPPENELQKIHETPMLSEHQLRVQASLQKLNIPDWYRQYNDSRGELRSPSSPAPPPGGTGNQRKRGLSSSGADATGIPPSSSTGGGHAKWTGLSSKTTSLSSLGGGGGGHGSQRYDKNSTMLLSPSSHSHHGGTTTTTTGYSRWSTNQLNSTQTSPSNSSASTTGRTPFTRGNYAQSSGHSFIHSGNQGTNIRGSYRQPYLGWRSQEKLSQGGLRTPAERLASTLLATQQQQQQQQQGKGEGVNNNNGSVINGAGSVGGGGGGGGDETAIQSSIKEVTSAIVHYVNDQTNRSQNTNQGSRSRSTSPR